VLAFTLLLATGACSADGSRTPAAGGAEEDASKGSDARSPDPADAACCGSSDEDAAPGPTSDAGKDAGPKPAFACKADATFPGSLQVPEASGAAEVELRPGVRELLVVSDSGRGGASMLIGIPAGAQRSVTLPVDAATASDDLEGIAWRSGKLYTLTSSGAVRRFAPDGSGGLVRDQDAYRLGDAPSACADLSAVNCGRNYEGLCLRAPGAVHPCAGYAASKAEGKLYCLDIDGGGKLVAKPSVAPLTLAVAADQLSDCAFGAAGGPAESVLVVTTNVFGLSRSYRVDEASGALTKLPTPSLLNIEAAAIDRDGAIYVFDDNSSSQSSAAKATCVGW
jgi:hypothetical protein